MRYEKNNDCGMYVRICGQIALDSVRFGHQTLKGQFQEAVQLLKQVESGLDDELSFASARAWWGWYLDVEEVCPSYLSSQVHCLRYVALQRSMVHIMFIFDNIMPDS